MNNQRQTLAVLMTCHNRRETTLRCLDKLAAQTGLEHIRITIFLVDDGSTDGTAAAVIEKYPEVRVLAGDGSLYWTGGMSKAMGVAMAEGFDFYLWLNDDTMLFPDALKRLFIAAKEIKAGGDRATIVIGSLCDPETGELTYGGWIRSSRWHPLRFRQIQPSEILTKCDVFNGNLVLLNNHTANIVGNLHPKLVHAQGDFEYGLRANRYGFKGNIAPGFLGVCARNTLKQAWKDSDLSLRNKLKIFLGAKECPIVDRYHYCRSHGGLLWILIFLGPYIKLIMKHYMPHQKTEPNKNKREV